jgi:hypothetical protein
VALAEVLRRGLPTASTRPSFAALHWPSQAWIAALRGSPAVRDAAVEELHALLMRGARFELNRRRAMLSHVSHGEVDDLATQAADDALVAVLATHCQDEMCRRHRGLLAEPAESMICRRDTIVATSTTPVGDLTARPPCSPTAAASATRTTGSRSVIPSPPASR